MLLPSGEVLLCYCPSGEVTLCYCHLVKSCCVIVHLAR